MTKIRIQRAGEAVSKDELSAIDRLGEALFVARDKRDKAALAEAVDDIEVMHMHTTDPLVSAMCGGLLIFRNL